jgi:hypothetical protein
MGIENLMQQAIRAAEVGYSPIYTPDHARTLRWLLARTHIRTEGEIVTPGIAPQNVQEAVSLSFVGGQPVFGAPMSNSAFQDANTTISPDVPNLPDFLPPASIRMDYGLDLLAAACSMLCDDAMPATRRTLGDVPAATPASSDGYCMVYRRNLPTPLMQYLLLL